jgi:uncharacterized protein (TIGR03067 family)
MDAELENLQGQWEVTFLEVEGLALVASTFSGAKIVVEGNKFTSIGMGATYVGRIELDVSTNPKTLSMKFTEGPEKGNTNFGIYELEGDSWKICLTMTGGPAPAKFATAPGSGHALETLRRETRVSS